MSGALGRSGQFVLARSRAGVLERVPAACECGSCQRRQRRARCRQSSFLARHAVVVPTPGGDQGRGDKPERTSARMGRQDLSSKEAGQVGAAQEILTRLAGGDVVVIDGGTGTQLQAAGAPMDDEAWSARASVEQPGLVQAVHEAYLRAGAEVIITNTFATNRAALEPAGMGDRVAEANRNAVAAALRAREATGRPAAVAGSMSSFCTIAMHGLGNYATDPDGAEDPRFPSLDNFREQAALLADAGVDLIALELMDAPGYGAAAIQAAAETGLPVWLGVAPVRLDDGSLGTDPMMGSGLGLSFAELV